MKGIGKPFLLGLGVKVEEIDIEKEMVFWRHILAAGVGEIEVTLQVTQHPFTICLLLVLTRACTDVAATSAGSPPGSRMLIKCNSPLN